MTWKEQELAEIIPHVWPDWEVSEKVGSGHFGSVYRASRRDRIAGEKDSAIKIIRIPGSDSDWDSILAEGKTEEQAERYFQEIVDDSLREIRAMEELAGNTNIVSIFDYKVHRVPEKHIWYILIRMEFLQKVDVSGIREDEIIRMGSDLCTALSICRKKNIVHRDVSLDNVFIRDGNYKLGDFGVAKVLEGTVGTMQSFAGKPLYMAPEVYNATLLETDIDSAARVDIYSLGIMLYRLANHMKYPFENPDTENVTAKERNEAFRRRVIEGEELPPPKDASPELAAVILRACMARPEKRFESADAMKEALLSVHKKPEPDRSAPEKPGPGRSGRKKALWIAVAVLAAAALCALLLKTFLASPEWSEWSNWSEERANTTYAARVQEETREVYKWVAVKCGNCGGYNPEGVKICMHCQADLPEEPTYVYEYKTERENGINPGDIRSFDNKLFRYAGPVTQYRFRTVAAEKPAAGSILGTWYYSSYENSETYPGIVFLADGGDRCFTVLTGGENLKVEDRRNGEAKNRDAKFEDGILTVGYDSFALEDGKLVLRYGSVTEVYTREQRERQIPADLTVYYADGLRPEHYNGTWIITQYGMNNAYTDAETMGLAGKAEIRDGKITVTWTRNGQEKSFEQAFDPELNRGRLYTVVNNAVSYIVSMRADHTILLNVGLNQAQWVMKKENVPAGETVRLDLPEFEETFSGKEDWTASEETRNELAGLLLKAALENGADPEGIRMDGSFCLALKGGPAYPVLVCEGTGNYEHFVFTVGRGVQYDTKEPFVYYSWEDGFLTELAHPGMTAAEYQRNEMLPFICGDRVWEVQVNAE